MSLSSAQFMRVVKKTGLLASWTRQGAHPAEARGAYGEAKSETVVKGTDIPCMWDELRSDEAGRFEEKISNATSSPILFLPNTYGGNAIDILEGDIVTLNRQKSNVEHYRVQRVPDATSMEHHYEVVMEEVKRT